MNCVAMYQLTTLFLLSNISGAIQPSVPATPDLAVIDTFPIGNFRHKPKSDIIALNCPFVEGNDNRTLRGLMSR